MDAVFTVINPLAPGPELYSSSRVCTSIADDESCSSRSALHDFSCRKRTKLANLFGVVYFTTREWHNFDFSFIIFWRKFIKWWLLRHVAGVAIRLGNELFQSLLWVWAMRITRWSLSETGTRFTVRTMLRGPTIHRSGLLHGCRWKAKNYARTEKRLWTRYLF